MARLRTILVGELAMHGLDPTAADPDDIAQQTILTWLDRETPPFPRWPQEAPLAAWVRGIARLAAREARRGLRPADAESRPDDRPRARPPRRALGLAELVVEIAELPSRLPQPHGWILSRLLVGDTTAEIAEGLRKWRGVGPDESRRLVREAKRAARSVIEGDEAAFRALLARQKKRKTPWNITPPN